MRDTNKEMEQILDTLDVRVVFSSPAECGELPVISYYTLTEKPGFCSDNEEQITDTQVQIDIWADEGYKCGMLGLEVNDIMRSHGFCRELALDVPKGEDGVYHRSMRFVKSYMTN